MLGIDDLNSNLTLILLPEKLKNKNCLYYYIDAERKASLRLQQKPVRKIWKVRLFEIVLSLLGKSGEL